MATSVSTPTAAELAAVENANASGRRPVVFVHGLWLLGSSWQRWADFFEAAGYAPLTPGWPDDPESVAAARATPDAFAGKGVGDVADYLQAIIERLGVQPILVGHSFGGLLVQILAGRGLAAATVAIDPAPSRGVLPLPISSLRASFPVLGNPANRSRAVTLTLDQFTYGFANAVTPDEARTLYDTYHVAAPGRPLFQAAVGNFNPRSETTADNKRADRGPLLVISGERDNIVPWAIANATFKRQSRNAKAVTEIVEIPGRGHSLTIDAGWADVAQAGLDFVTRVLPTR